MSENVQFEVQYFDTDGWKPVPERTILETFQENFGMIDHMLNAMLDGKVVMASDGIYRIKTQSISG